MPRATETTLVIDLVALAHNYRVLRSKTLPETKFLAVVKAAGYGSEAVAVAKELEILGVDYFAVAYVSEGVALRKAGISSPILVFHPQPVNFSTLIDHCLEPSLYAPKILKLFLATAKNHKQENYPVHLKFNTGLNRLGFWEKDVDYIEEALKDQTALKVISIFSHLAASEDLNEEAFTKNQIADFNRIAGNCESALGCRPMRHLLNTSGIYNYPEAQLDMVRSGIGLYGYGNDPGLDAELRPISTLKTIISQLHQIEPGETVGYNRAFTSKDRRLTATLPIGHADGIGRQYGNDTVKVLVHGKPAPVIGNVCMDMMMIDVTGIECEEGDEVIIFGPEHSAEDMAAAAGTITYELLTGISGRIKRLIIKP